MNQRPRRTARQRLQDKLDAIERIETYTHGKSYRDFAADLMLRDSVERNIERLSEASRHLPNSITDLHKEIPWRVVERDLSPLKKAVENLIEQTKD